MQRSFWQLSGLLVHFIDARRTMLDLPSSEYSMVGWLVVFCVPSTDGSFRDGIPVYSPLRRTRSFLTVPLSALENTKWRSCFATVSSDIYIWFAEWHVSRHWRGLLIFSLLVNCLGLRIFELSRLGSSFQTQFFFRCDPMQNVPISTSASSWI